MHARHLFRILSLLACLAGGPAAAHQMPQSTVLLDIRSDRIEAELQLPVDRLQVALRHDPAAQVAGRFVAAGDMLGADRGRVGAGHSYGCSYGF